MNKKEELFQAFAEYDVVLREAREKYSKNAEEWWDGLSEDEKIKAFYTVIKRVYQADVIDQGSYRYALYEVFGFDFSSYAIGMDCGYLDIHNLIFDGIKYQRLKGKGLIPDDKVIDEPNPSST
jgi:hypothetical protein